MNIMSTCVEYVEYTIEIKITCGSIPLPPDVLVGYFMYLSLWGFVWFLYWLICLKFLWCFVCLVFFLGLFVCLFLYWFVCLKFGFFVSLVLCLFEIWFVCLQVCQMIQWDRQTELLTFDLVEEITKGFFYKSSLSISTQFQSGQKWFFSQREWLCRSYYDHHLRQLINEISIINYQIYINNFVCSRASTHGLPGCARATRGAKTSSAIGKPSKMFKK